MRIYLYIACILSSALTAAAPCRVETSSQFVQHLANIAQQGACHVERATIDATLQDAMDMAETAHVIEFSRAMTVPIDQATKLVGHKGQPLIIRTTNQQGVVFTTAQHSGDAHFIIPVGAGSVIISGVDFHDFGQDALRIFGDNASLFDVEISHSGANAGAAALTIQGRNTYLQNVSIVHARGTGIHIGEPAQDYPICAQAKYYYGKNTQLIDSHISHSGAHGISIRSRAVRIDKSVLTNNAGAGVVIHGQSIEQRCTTQGAAPISSYNGAAITQTTFWKNDQGDVVNTFSPPPQPIDVINIAPPHAEYLTILGSLERMPSTSPWRATMRDPERAYVELYAARTNETQSASIYLGKAALAAHDHHQFLATLSSASLRERGISDPAQLHITARFVNEETMQSSQLSETAVLAKSTDWDADGLTNYEEDLNADGLVEHGETNPRLADTDGDGLSDGEERLLGGRIAERSDADDPLRIEYPTVLDPRHADSDGDCLPDGLELGLRSDHLRASSAIVPPRLELGAHCITQLQARQIFALTNSEAWNPDEEVSLSNMRAMHDLDPNTQTDPSAADSDADGVSDGFEDWNFDGQRSQAAPENATDASAVLTQTTPRWIESDPTLADSDSDGLLDGEEVDPGVQPLEPTDANVLLADTDDDGVNDADERNRYNTAPNNCDTDGDGLSDGIEAGVIHPFAATAQCAGLQAEGSNFASIGVLDPRKDDADGDGLSDGDEDRNGNGWLDAQETDPTSADSDHDSLNDYQESTGDFDGDGIIDFDIRIVNNGSSCAPPINHNDLDCDGLPNARDDDSDNDGCSDRSEGLGVSQGNGLPAAYNAKIKACKASGGGSAASGSSSASTPATPDANIESHPHREHVRFEKTFAGGGACTLMLPPRYLDSPTTSR